MLADAYSYTFFVNVLLLYVYTLALKINEYAPKVLEQSAYQHHLPRDELQMNDESYADKFWNEAMPVPSSRLKYDVHRDQLADLLVN